MSIPLRVLILEDQPADAELLALELQRAGFEPHWQRVETESEFLAHLDPALDLILADYSLPQFNGLSALQLVQERGLDVPFILVSGTIGEDLAVEAMKRGATDYLLKDRLTRLGQAVTHALEQRRLRDEKQRAEQALRDSEKRFRAVVQAANDPIISADSRGNIVGWNRAAQTIFGHTEEEMLGKQLIHLMPEHHIGDYREAWERWRLTGQSRLIGKTLEVHGRRKDGSEFPAEYSLVAWQIEQETFLTAFMRDITARKQAEERLRLQSTALEAAANGIVITDRDGTILWVNPSFTRLTGYTAEEAIGKNPRILKSGRQDQIFYQKLWETILAGKVWQGEVVNRRKDGSLYTEEMTLTPLKDVRGEISHFIAIKQDITERKRAEEALREADQRAIRDYERLLERLSQLAQTVGTARDLTAVYRSLREFAEASAPCNGLFVSLYDPQRQQRICVYSGGDGEEDDVSTLPPLPMNDSPQSRAIATGQVVATDDFQTAVAGKPVVTLGTEQDPRLPQSSLAVPLTVLGRVIGAFEVQSIERAAYQPEHVTAMRMAANLAAIATENVQMLERERELRLGAEMSEERYRTLAEAAQDAIFIIGRDDRVEYVNSFAASQFSSRAEELIGKTRAALFPPHVAEEQSRALQEVFETGNSIYAEAKTVYPTGEVWIGTRLVPIRNAAGEVRAVLGIARDITERKRAEDRLIAINDLGRALAETLDLSEIYERLYTAIVRLLPDSVTVFISMFDPERELITCAYGVHEGQRLNPAELPPIPLEPPGAGTQSMVIRTGKPLIANDFRERLKGVRVNVTVGSEGPSTQSALYIPMLAKGRVIGVAQVQSMTADRYAESDADLLALVANTAAVAIENAQLFAETKRRLERLQALRTIDTAITASLDLHVTLNVILDQVTTQLRVDAADVLLLNLHTQRLEFAAGRGFRTSALQHTYLRVGDGHAGRAVLERRVIKVPDLVEEMDNLARSPLLAQEGFVAYYAAPLVAKGQMQGVLELFHRATLEPDREWLDFLEGMAAQVAIAIDNAALFNNLQRSNVELALAYDATIEGWSRALDLRDKETEGHTQRVTEITERLARAMDIPESQLVHIRRGALLHDIGKMGVPDPILLKPGSLTDEEWKIMRQHPVFAYEMLLPITYLRPALDIPYCHHEKWDGTGYPRGLKAEQIPLVARIFAVVDVWDALRSGRPYRPAWSKEKTIEHIREQVGKHFDPKVVEAFIEMLRTE